MEINRFLNKINNVSYKEKYMQNISRRKFELLKSKLDAIKDEPIAIYGIGSHTEQLLKHIDFSEYNLVGLIDKTNQNRNLFGCEVFSLNSIIGKIKYIIISSISFQETIYDRISWVKEKGIGIIKIYEKDDFQTERLYLFDDEDLGVIQNIGLENELYIHLNRYLWAKILCGGKNVLDSACGCGYGSIIVSDVAKSVVGVDLDEPTIKYAKKHFNESNITFLCSDLRQLNSDMTYDVILSFETIEHIENEILYMEKIKELLNENGIFVVSTPAAQEDGTNDTNRYHVNEYTEKRFTDLLKANFEEVDLFVQVVSCKGAIVFREAIEGDLENGSKNTYNYILIAICRNKIDHVNG